MTIKLNSQVFSDLVESNEIKLMRKRQPNKDDSYNYYILPKLTFGLYGAKVIVVDPKYVVLQFEKISAINLLALFRQVSTYFTNKISVSNKRVHGFFVEQENTFTIRCSLPGYKGKYFINSGEEPFKIPKKNANLNYVEVDIRNIWETDAKVGFNLELKQIKIEI